MATVGAKNQPIVQTTDAFNPVSDINTLSNWVANNFASTKILTGSTLHTSLTGADLFAGLLTYETSTGQYWRYDGTSWFIEPIGTPPRAELTKSTTQSVTSGGSGATVTTWVQTQARGMTVSASAGTVTLPYSGRYSIYAQVIFASFSSGYGMTQIQANASTVARTTQPNTAGTLYVPIQMLYTGTVGDIISINALQSSGSAVNVTNAKLIVEFVGQ